MSLNDKRSAASRAQEAVYGEEYDYDVSPHIHHTSIREQLEDKIDAAVREVLARQQSCAVLEVGAGHGNFTEVARRAGGTVTVTEMSRMRVDYLKDRFRGVPDVRIVYDPDGNAAIREGAQFDVILLISVIHHIPDYVGVITMLCDEALRPGGTVLTFQDPLWYPRQSKWSTTVNQIGYLAWRVTQGELRRGFATRWRRMRGIYDETQPSDMVEYHVVRQGVDECALMSLFEDRFAEVELDSYFSTGLPLVQKVGARYFPHNTFGILARDHK
jgi:SAM-dependent methyltransferase